ncbi:hypothetical protein KFK09_029333 [Dendrobium nobile]|uniref:P-type ATPase N-terminal domain-containing protein n=1 Tax=Dendrobium nobile TaxID=94219 RepID=A0A8T3A0J9_DENNO|nr:hypothetical protein KFK09_029333 [Dendrobium nobile]
MARSGKIRDKLRREKLRWSKLYTFNCARANPELIDFADPFSGLQGPGFSRKVQCNQPSLHRRKSLHYPSNYISTTKYNIITFLPKAIFEQFRRVANLYFLLAAVLSLTPIAPFSAVSMIAPLAFVVGLSMAKEAVEDWRRFMQDMKVNKRKVSIHKGDGNFCYKKWHKIFVEFGWGDKFEVKRALDVTLHFDEDKIFKDFYATIRCEDPNPSLYTFVGNLEYEKQVCSLDPNQILLRDSKLRNTSYIYGVVIFTGHDSKRSSIEKKMDYIIYILFTLLYAVYTKFGMPNWWYLQPENASTLYNPLMPALSGIFHLVTALIMYGYLIPVSLYVSIEVVKDTGKPAEARTSNLNEELGQVDIILSDKTGTLTCNQMDFLKCFIAGVSYGVGSSEVEIAAAKHIASEFSGSPGHNCFPADYWDNNVDDSSVIQLEDGITCKVVKDPKHNIKGFSFEDDHLMQGNWVKEPSRGTLQMFFRVLAVCHTAIPEHDEENGTFTYEAESPDEGAFLVAPREFGFEFFKRTQEFKILNLMEFNSKRKRMSVIVRDDSGQIILLCKGADRLGVLPRGGVRLARSGRMYLACKSNFEVLFVFEVHKLFLWEDIKWYRTCSLAVPSMYLAVLSSIEHVPSKYQAVGVAPVEDKIRESRLRWFVKTLQIYLSLSKYASGEMTYKKSAHEAFTLAICAGLSKENEFWEGEMGIGWRRVGIRLRMVVINYTVDRGLAKEGGGFELKEDEQNELASLDLPPPPQTNPPETQDRETNDKAAIRFWKVYSWRSDGEIDGDIISRIQVGWLKWRNASGLLCDRKVPLKLKGKFYKMVVRPAMLYGAECWPLKEKHNTKLSVVEMRMLRWMSGFTLKDRIQNEHIREKVGVASVEDKIRESHLRWLGHIKRRPSNDPVRRVEGFLMGDLDLVFSWLSNAKVLVFHPNSLVIISL